MGRSDDMDRAYLEQRLAEEAERARSSTCDVARAAHRQLAELYRARLSAPPLR
jgi:hypothetical protein